MSAPLEKTAMTEAEFGAWLHDAKPGATIEYHRGHLAEDKDAQHSTMSGKDRRRLMALAVRAQDAADRGLCLLVQKRLGPALYSYRAVRRRTMATQAEMTAAATNHPIR